jgi:glycosyltransferase involved in cell wall biosynthesis
VNKTLKNQLFSVLIISYKNLLYIYDAINSVLEQDYPNIELIICDDGTEDFHEKDYIDYITSNKRGNISKLIVHKNESNLGITKNMNNAIRLSDGEYIKILAADDALYNSNVLSSFAKYFEKNDSNIILSKVIYCDKNLKKLNKRQFEYKFEDELHQSRKFFIRCCKENFIAAPGVCYTKKFFNLYGCFDERYFLLNDWPTWLRLSRNNFKFEYLDMVSVKWRIGSGVSTGGNNRILKEDNIKCFNNEIRPYKDILGYWEYRKIHYLFIKRIEYTEYPRINKILFLLTNLDFYIPEKILHIIKEKL